MRYRRRAVQNLLEPNSDVVNKYSIRDSIAALDDSTRNITYIADIAAANTDNIKMEHNSKNQTI
jgi:hypothetical protein